MVAVLVETFGSGSYYKRCQKSEISKSIIPLLKVIYYIYLGNEKINCYFVKSSIHYLEFFLIKLSPQ